MKPLALAKSGFVRFGMFGVLATLIHVVTFTLLVELLRFPPVIASLPAFIFAMLFSYAANYKWTFQATAGYATHLPRYAMVSLIGLGLNVLITYAVVDVLGLWYGMALVVVVSAVPVVTYLLNRNWTYGTRIGAR